MIKLALCITELNIGGAERALCDLAIRIDKSRFDVTVYSLQGRPADDRASCVPRLEAAGIPMRFLDMKGTRSFLPGFFRLRKFLKEWKPDVFLSFLFHANFLGRLAARSAGVRHVVSGIRVAEREKPWHLTLDRLTAAWVETYVCVSDSVAEFTRVEGRIPAEKIVVIPNGIEMPELPAGRKRRILFVGRLTHQKGLDWFFETVPDWLPKLPGWELWIVGDGEMRDDLATMWKSPRFEKVRDSVKLTGWREDATDLPADSRILVLPSRWEGMPNVVMQAMAVGIPVVATQVEGVLELLGPGAERQSCRFGDGAALAERILALANDPETAEKLGRENRRRIEEHFRIEAVIGRYERLFEHLV